MIAAVLFISFAVLLLIGTPIAICLGVSSVVAMLIQGAAPGGDHHEQPSPVVLCLHQ